MIIWSEIIVIVGICMIIEKHARRYIECDKHIDTVMLMASQDKKYTKEVKHPGDCV